MENETQFFYATEDTYAIAAELSEQGFEEQESLLPYDECDMIFVNITTNKFEFTSKDIIEFMRKEVTMKKITLNTIEQWKTN